MTVRVVVPVTALWTSPDAVDERDAAAVADMPDAGAWAAGLDDDARRGLLGRIDTQALLGEPVIVLAEADGWSRVRLPWQASSQAVEGYPGWVRSSHLLEAQDAAPGHPDAPQAAVTELTAVAHDESGAELTLSFGTVLPLEPSPEGEARLRHPDGRLLTLPAAAVTPLAEREPAPGPRAALLARRFLGLPYLWAGLSGHGVDCSGLVHLCYRAVGVRMPRDGHDQAIAGRPLAPDEVRVGDPVYFENDTSVHHVGLALSAERMLHSPRTGLPVAEVAIGDPRYSGERVGFRRFE